MGNFKRQYDITKQNYPTYQSGAPWRGGVYVKGAGDISLTSIGGTTRIYTVAADTTIKGEFVRVNSTGTTATGIVGFN